MSSDNIIKVESRIILRSVSRIKKDKVGRLSHPSMITHRGHVVSLSSKGQPESILMVSHFKVCNDLFIHFEQQILF